MEWIWPHAWLRDKNKRNEGRPLGIRLRTAAFCRQMCQHLHLPRAFETACVPLSPEEASWWKIQLSEDLGLVHTAKTFQQFLAELWNSGRLASIFAGLVHAGLLDLACSAGESPGDTSLQSHCPASVYHCGMGAARGEIHLQDLLLIRLLPGDSCGEKWRWHWINGLLRVQ